MRATHRVQKAMHPNRTTATLETSAARTTRTLGMALRFGWGWPRVQVMPRFWGIRWPDNRMEVVRCVEEALEEESGKKDAEKDREWMDCLERALESLPWCKKEDEIVLCSQGAFRD